MGHVKPQSVAVFPGSFDPLTSGHVDIIERSLAVFERVIIAVIRNPTKAPLLSIEERVELIRKTFPDQIDRIEVDAFTGLLAEYLRIKDHKVVIRGLRAISDFDYEAQMALVNRHLNSNLETFFMVAREEHSYISSSLVKQIAPLGGDVSKMVPPHVGELLKKKFAAKKA